MRQTLHVIVTTYTEPLAMVRECVTRLLVAPDPIYCEKTVYVCDDGHADPGGPEKLEMVRHLHRLGACFHACMLCMRRPLLNPGARVVSDTVGPHPNLGHKHWRACMRRACTRAPTGLLLPEHGLVAPLG